MKWFMQLWSRQVQYLHSGLEGWTPRDELIVQLILKGYQAADPRERADVTGEVQRQSAAEFPLAGHV